MNRRQLLVGGGAVALGGAGIVGVSVARMGSSADYDSAVAAARGALARSPSIPDLLRYATLAANGHNTQPWKFRVSDGAIDILPDLTRRTPVVDPDDHHLFASLGCAAENLAIASAARGRPGEIDFGTDGRDSVRFAFGQKGASTPSDMFDPIPHRQGLELLHSACDGKAGRGRLGQSWSW